jgi:phage gp29-like protein
MAGPSRNQFAQIPYASYAGVDNIVDVEGILRAFEYGNMRSASMFADQMLRDDRVSGVLNTRSGGLLATPLNIKPSDKSEKAAKIAELLGGDGDNLTGCWEELFPSETISELLRWGHMLGLGVAEIIWKGDGKANTWTPRLRVWHPQFVYWNWATFSFWIITGDGVQELPKIDENPRSDGKWVVWCPRGYTFGWMHGLVRALARLYIMRAWNYRDWSRYCEVYGSPMKKGIVPAGADDDVKARFKSDLMAAGADGVIIVPQGTEGKIYDVQMIESKSRGYTAFADFKAAIDVDIAICINGQNLTTEATGGGLGGGQAAQVMNSIRGDYAAQDAKIAKIFRQQVLTHWALANFKDAELAPRPVFGAEDADDGDDATAMKTLGEGLAALQLAKVPIDVRTIVDRFGIPMLSSEEEQELKDEEAEKAAEAAKANLPPGGQGGSNGGATPPAKPNPFQSKPKGGLDSGADAKMSSTDVVKVPDRLPMPVTRYEFAGLKIAVENPAATIRLWTYPDGKTMGATKMKTDYGYIEGHIGSDDEEVDVYVGPNEAAPFVYVIHQMRADDPTKADEDKVFLGFDSEADAKAMFCAHRNDGETCYGGMSAIPLDEFKRKLLARTGKGRIRARSSADEVVALRASVTHARSAAGNKRASAYATALMKKSAMRGQAAMRSMLEEINTEIAASTSPDDFRARMVKLAKADTGEALAVVVAKARLMANLAGRSEILEGL